MPRDDDILVKIYERSTRDRRVNGPLRIVDGSALSARRNFSPVSQRRHTRRNIWNNVDLIIRACG